MAQCFRSLKAQVIKGCLHLKTTGVGDGLTRECCLLRHTALGLGQSRKLWWRLDYSLSPSQCPRPQNKQTCSSPVNFHLFTHGLHTFVECQALWIHERTVTERNALSSHAGPQIRNLSTILARPSSSYAFLLSLLLVFTVIHLLHLNPPLPFLPYPKLWTFAGTSITQWPTLTGTRVWPCLPIHLPTLLPIIFLEGKSDQL